jgi:hypothetical protein
LTFLFSVKPHVETRRRVRIVVGGARIDRLTNDRHARPLDVAGIRAFGQGEALLLIESRYWTIGGAKSEKVTNGDGSPRAATGRD